MNRNLHRYLIVFSIFLTSISAGVSQKYETFEKKGKYGIRNLENNKVVVKPQYSWIGDVNDTYTIIKARKKGDDKEYSGLLYDGKIVVLPCDYEEISNPHKYADGIYRTFVKKEGKSYLYELNGASPNLYMSKPVKGFAVAKNGASYIVYETYPDQWVMKIIDNKGQTIFDNITESTKLNNYNLVIHDTPNNQYVLYDLLEGRIIGTKYKEFSSPNGFYTKTLVVIDKDIVHLEREPKEFEEFHSAYILDSNGKKKYGVIRGYSDDVASLVIPFQYDKLNLSRRTLNHHGRSAIPLRDFDILSINSNREIPDKYLNYLSQLNGWIEATVNGNNRKLFNEGRKISAQEDPEYIPETIMIGEWEIFSENNKKGLRKKDGEVLLPAIYSQISITPEGNNYYKDEDNFYGRFYLFKDNKKGLYNVENNKIIVPLMDWKSIISDYSFNGYKATGKDGSVYYYKLNGNKITGPFDYTVKVLEKGTAAKKNNKWGFFDYNGNLLIPFKHDDFNENLIGWCSNLFFIDSKGNTDTITVYNVKGKVIGSKSFKYYQEKAKEDFILNYCK